jgi:hypothetical protein
VDKSNVLVVSQLWREVVTDVGRGTPTSSSTNSWWTTAPWPWWPTRGVSTPSSPRTRSATSSRTRPRSSRARWACCRRRASARSAATARWALRADPRHRARHRRAGDREPAGGHPVGRDAAALLAGPAATRPGGAGGRADAGRGAPHQGHSHARTTLVGTTAMADRVVRELEALYR